MELLPSTEGRILRELHAQLDAARTVILASAFTTASGLKLLLPQLRGVLDRGGSISLYVTFDGGAFTQPGFFEIVKPLERKYAGRVDVFLYPHATTLFHAKTFLFERGDGTWTGIVGSANLTDAALRGTNFEVAASAPLAHAQVIAIRSELSRLLAEGRFRKLTPALTDQLTGAKNGAPPLSPEEQESLARARKNSEKRVRQALEAVKPGPLPPLPDLALPPAAYVEELCATGLAIATDDDLADLTVSIDLGVFVRARVVEKEATKKIGVLQEHNKKGLSLALVDAGVRAAVRAARTSIGKTLGLRAVDFGYLRWVPTILHADAIATIATKPEVVAARKAVATENPAISRHIASVRRSFAKSVTDAIARLELRPKADWDQDALERHGLSASVTISRMREQIQQHVVARDLERISESLVRSQLARLTFAPRTFSFPLAQSHASDTSYGHKHFLANLVWACTDRLLKRTTEDGGSGELFEYLNARRGLNAGRNKDHSAVGLATRAATWLEPEVFLATAVDQFREAYGPEPFTWQLGDLVTSLPPVRPSRQSVPA